MRSGIKPLREAGLAWLAVLVALGGWIAPAHAATYTWKGTTSALWTNALNWDPDTGTPNAADTAVFNGASGNTTIDLSGTSSVLGLLFDTSNAAAYTIGSGGVNAQRLQLADSGSVAMTATVANNQTVNAVLALGTNASAGSYTLRNDGLTRLLTVSGSIVGGTGGSAAAKTLTVAGSGSTTISGVIANGGATSLALTKSDAGTLTLGTQQNTYTGGTIVNGGTLILSGNIGPQNNGVIRGSMTINPGAVVNASASNYALGYGGTASFAGMQGWQAGNSVSSITINGGSLNFTNSPGSNGGFAAADVTLTGGTISSVSGSFAWLNSNALSPRLQSLASSQRSTVSGIVLRMFGTGTSQPTFTFNVAAGSTADGIDLVVGQITRYSVTEDLTTSIIKAGSGTLRLTGTNTFVAPLAISGGKLEVGGSGNLGAGAYSAAISVAAGATMSYASSASQTLSGSITGAGGLAKSAASNLTLSAANDYTGPTTISGGTLSLTSSGAIASSGTVTVGDTGSTGAVLNLTSMSSSFAFGAGQTVRGIGRIDIGEGKTVSSAGIWAPGNSIGSNTVTGNLALTGTSQFELGTPGGSLSSPGSSDFTAVSGTLTLGGNLALLDNANAGGLGSYGAGAYRLFTASAVSGTFASVTAPAGATTTRVGMVYTAGTASGQGVFANVYNLANAASAQTINLGSMYSGTSKTAAVTLTNTAPSNATFTETLSGSFSGVTTNFLATGSVSGIAGGADGAGSLLVGLGSGLVAGIHSGTATLAVFSNAVNSSGLAQQSVGSQAITITGTVWNPAAVNTVSTPVSFGNVIVGGSFGTQALSITNTAPGGIYTEVLGATASTSGQATSLGSVAALAGGSTSTAISVGLGGAAYTGSVGVKTGTATLAFTSTGGPGTASIDSQAIALTGTVLDHAESSLAGTLLTGTTISLGQYNYASNAWVIGGDTGFFTIFNLASIFGADLTADLSLVGVSGTANGFTTNLGSYTDIAGGQSRQFSIFFDPTGLTTPTTRTTTFQIQLSDKTGMSGATNTNTLFVTAQVIVVPEPGSLTLAGVGIALTGWLVSRRKYINL